jgi:hypothetical protein
MYIKQLYLPNENWEQSQANNRIEEGIIFLKNACYKNTANANANQEKHHSPSKLCVAEAHQTLTIYRHAGRQKHGSLHPQTRRLH